MSSAFKFLIGNRPFNNILLKRKDLEGRLNKGKYKLLEVGDEVGFKNNQDLNEKKIIKAKITNIYNFPNFREAFKQLDSSRAIYGLTVEEVINEYHKYYSENEISKHGIVFFEFIVKQVV